MFQIKITTKKKEKMVEHAEKALRHMGKLMQCLDDLDEGDMGERYPMNERYGGGRMNEREDWDDDDDEKYPQMGERRRRGSNGRYM